LVLRRDTRIEQFETNMGSSENYCLQWNDFEPNIRAGFSELRENSDFSDLMLCCDNGQDVLSAHRFILAACSPLFENILSHQKNKENQFLYLKGIHLEELQAVLDFIYHGEVTVSQGSLNDVLAVAEELAIKGLSNDWKPHAADALKKKTLAAKRKYKPIGSGSAPQAAKKFKASDRGRGEEDMEQNFQNVNIKSEPEPWGNETNLNSYSYDTSGDAGNGDDNYFGDANEIDPIILQGATPNKKRKYTLEFKLMLVEEAKNGNNRSVAQKYDLPEKCVRYWRKNEQKITEALAQAGNKEIYQLPGSGRKRDDLLEQILFDWYTQQKTHNLKITSRMLRIKAKELSASSSNVGDKEKKYSSGWVEGFKKAYGIKTRDEKKPSSKDHKAASNDLMERILHDWVVHQQVNNASLSGQMVRAKAEELSKACSPHSDYKFTIGWLDGFKKRYNIRLGDKIAPATEKPSTSADVKPSVLLPSGVFFPPT